MTRESRVWLALSLLFAGGVWALFSRGPSAPTWAFAADPVHPAVGWAAAGVALFTLLYAWRKRELLQAPGPLIWWKWAHMAAGYAFTLLWVWHADASVGFAPVQWGMSTAILGLFATGVWGLYAQGSVPSVMNETLIDPVYRDALKGSAGDLVVEIGGKMAGCSREFHLIFQRHILPFIVIPNPSADVQKAMLKRLFGPGDLDRNAAVHDVARLSPAERNLFYEVAEKGLDVVEIRRSLTYQGRMNRWLVWHVTLTVALVIFVLFHVLSAFYY
ncbi:MAG: hypothetical protein HQK87_01815 [Nitrospinae bacterium]|nr:hypothetical protein [Nitrospinota bacterium]